MIYNILGINPTHHASACLIKDGELKSFIQEERLTKKKYDWNPYKAILSLLKNNKIDYITFGSPSLKYPQDDLNDEKYYNSYWHIFASKFNSYNIQEQNYSDYHHKCHVAHAFYNSGFKNAIGVVIDGLGSMIGNLGQETESIYKCSYPSNFKKIYKNLWSSNIKKKFKDTNVTTNINLSRVYESVTMYLGWSRDEAGKTMGLAPYGKYNPTFPNFFIKNTGNPDIFYFNSIGTFVDEKYNPQLKLKINPKEWHHNESKITDLEKDLAWQVQNDTQQIVGDYIEKSIKETGLNKFAVQGGYFLNCVTNYYLIKRFPDIEFYFEPIANDAGTAIGAAKLLWHEYTQDTTIRPFKSLYLGKQYSKEELLEGIKKYVDN
jgi:carbamoyltransferase